MSVECWLCSSYRRTPSWWYWDFITWSWLALSVTAVCTVRGTDFSDFSGLFVWISLWKLTEFSAAEFWWHFWVKAVRAGPEKEQYQQLEFCSLHGKGTVVSAVQFTLKNPFRRHKLRPPSSSYLHEKEGRENNPHPNLLMLLQGF